MKALWQQTGENGRDFTEIMFGVLSLFEINEVPAILSCKHPGQTITRNIAEKLLFTEETIQNWKNSEKSNKDQASDENRTGEVCIDRK